MVLIITKVTDIYCTLLANSYMSKMIKNAQHSQLASYVTIAMATYSYNYFHDYYLLSTDSIHVDITQGYPGLHNYTNTDR